MLQKLPLNKLEWIENTSQFNEDFIKNYNEETDEGCSLKVDLQYREKLRTLHNDLPFLPERMKLEKPEKVLANLYHKIEYVIHMQAWNHGLILKKVHGLIKFNQKAWLKP